ncbi:MAG: NAD-dependent deacylase [Chitinophagaceae bacterium]|nr:NAD-dependent deacylase [Chitinophagaceae bacterium]
MKKHIVVLTGAGISAESGLKTFRDSDGLWMGYDVYEVASPAGWEKDPAFVLDFYNMRRRDVAQALPNAAHKALAALEENFKVTIVTQNIDDLHERGGSTNVIHLHGEIFKMRGSKDQNKSYEIRGDINVGDKDVHGEQLRPHIVWFDEPVPLIMEAKKIMAGADIFILVGTSMQVYPASGLINYIRPGVPKYIIDKKIPAISYQPNLFFIEKPATEGMDDLLKILLS